MATTWEYQSLTREHIYGTPYESIETLLNPLGLEGWELVAVMEVRTKYEDRIFENFYLKRAKP